LFVVRYEIRNTIGYKGSALLLIRLLLHMIFGVLFIDTKYNTNCLLGGESSSLVKFDEVGYSSYQDTIDQSQSCEVL